MIQYRSLDAGVAIASLGLIPHPEGGWFKETYRGPAAPGAGGAPRSVCTGIYYLLAKGDFSAFHRIDADEMWHLYQATPSARLRIWCIAPGSAGGNGAVWSLLLGSDLSSGETFQVVVPAGTWFAAEVESEVADAYVLSGCTVAPGFEYGHFEMARTADLSALCPSEERLIRRLCRDT